MPPGCEPAWRHWQVASVRGRFSADVLADWFVSLTGSVLILFSAFCFMAAVWRELEAGRIAPRPELHRLPTWLLLSVNGFLVLVAVAALVSVWLISV